MKVTTTRSFRRQHINHYKVDDFADDWDYFVYLHLNPHVQALHLIGTLIAIPLFPWAMLRLFRDWSVWPLAVFTFFYYGFGFLSHYTGDGVVSGTWRNLWRTYQHAAKMNLLLLARRFKFEEIRVVERYPHMLWVYETNRPIPPTAAGPDFSR